MKCVVTAAAECLDRRRQSGEGTRERPGDEEREHDRRRDRSRADADDHSPQGPDESQCPPGGKGLDHADRRTDGERDRCDRHGEPAPGGRVDDCRACNVVGNRVANLRQVGLNPLAMLESVGERSGRIGMEQVVSVGVDHAQGAALGRLEAVEQGPHVEVQDQHPHALAIGRVDRRGDAEGGSVGNLDLAVLLVQLDRRDVDRPGRRHFEGSSDVLPLALALQSVVSDGPWGRGETGPLDPNQLPVLPNPRRDSAAGAPTAAGPCRPRNDARAGPAPPRAPRGSAPVGPERNPGARASRAAPEPRTRPPESRGSDPRPTYRHAQPRSAARPARSSGRSRCSSAMPLYRRSPTRALPWAQQDASRVSRSSPAGHETVAVGDRW